MRRALKRRHLLLDASAAFLFKLVQLGNVTSCHHVISMLLNLVSSVVIEAFIFVDWLISLDKYHPRIGTSIRKH